MARACRKCSDARSITAMRGWALSRDQTLMQKMAASTALVKARVKSPSVSCMVTGSDPATLPKLGVSAKKAMQRHNETRSGRKGTCLALISLHSQQVGAHTVPVVVHGC